MARRTAAKMEAMSEASKSRMTRKEILAALEALSVALGARDAKGEVCLFGGTVMVLAFQARVATKDVDALFQPTEAIRQGVREVAEELELPPDWLNDGVKGFVSARHEVTAEGLPQFPNLRLTMPTAEYLLAMKCMAARVGAGDEPSDVADIRFLIRHLGLASPEAVLDLTARYYGKDRIPVKTQYLVEGIFAEARP